MLDSYKLLATPVEIKTAKEHILALVEKAVEAKTTVSTNYVIVGLEAFRDIGLAVCHASIGNPLVPDIRCVATEIAVQRRRLRFTDERPNLTDSYINFLLTDKLWAPWIIDSGENYITIDAGAPQNVFQAFLMASRSVWEASEESFDMFDEALERGLPARIAFIYAFHSNISTREYTRTGPNANRSLVSDSTILACKCNHRPFGLLSKESLYLYLNGKFRPSEPYNKYHSTSGVQRMFGLVRSEYEYLQSWLISDLFKDEEFVEALREFRKRRQKEEGVAVPNPFLKTVQTVLPKSGEITVAEYRSIVLDYLVKEFSKASVEKELEYVEE